MFRRTRITLSVCFAIMCAALIVLWARSYRRMDQVYGYCPEPRLVHFGSMCGQLTLRIIKKYNAPSRYPYSWQPDGEAVADIMQRQQNVTASQRDLLIYRYSSNYGKLRDGVYFPHWVAVIVTAALAFLFALPIPLRFSLRTMSIAMVLIALLLGLVAWQR